MAKRWLTFLAMSCLVSSSFAASAAPSNPVPASFDCAALKKQPDGAWLVTRSTTIVDMHNNSWALDAGQVIGPGSIIVSPASPLSEIIDKACAQ